MPPSTTIDRLTGAGGALVEGVRLDRPLTAGEVESVLALLDEHLVVAFTDQHLDLDRLEALTDELGGRDATPYVEPLDDRPYVIRVIKEPHDRLNFANAWHTDLSYLPAPPAYTVLQAAEVPDAGGDTLFANQYQAFETLPDDVRERIADLRGIHSAGMAYGTGGYLESVADQSSMRIAPAPEAYDTTTHPLVIRHPRTGRSALFANPVYTIGIEGLDEAEASRLLGRLFQHAVNPNFTCRIRWRPGMVTIWDNRCTQHFAVNDYAGRRREMFRTSVRGAPPLAAG